MRYWLWSDLHINHDRILELGKHRGARFADIVEMNEHIIKTARHFIKPEDTIFLLGDILFRPRRSDHMKLDEFMVRFPGHKHLIRGNHDYQYYNSANPDESIIDHWGWVSSQDYLEFRYGKTAKFVMMHYPIASWHGAHRGTIHVHGHLHKNTKFDGVPHRFDVGFDCSMDKPFNIDEIVEMARQQPYNPEYHHNDD